MFIKFNIDEIIKSLSEQLKKIDDKRIDVKAVYEFPYIEGNTGCFILNRSYYNSKILYILDACLIVRDFDLTLSIVLTYSYDLEDIWKYLKNKENLRNIPGKFEILKDKLDDMDDY